MTAIQLSIFTLICSVLTICANYVQGVPVLESLPGMAVLLGIIAGGVAIHRLIPWKGLPAVAYITTLGCIVTIPDFVPGAAWMTAATSKISFLGLCTPILAYAGLAIGKDMDLLKKQGWRIVLVGLVVFVGTFLGSAIIAEVVLRAMK
ncbi:MAG: DUF340 domain-containing protein [Pyramidobacter sp.]|nr:DUF340 domain-containing protein [Pyramidobacter sp.]